MSYRALVTIIEGDIKEDFVALLDPDTFSEGEKLAHAFGKAKSGEEALKLGMSLAMSSGDILGVNFESLEQRADYAENWCDQRWSVTFAQVPDQASVDIKIEGFDAHGEQVFMRKIRRAVW